MEILISIILGVALAVSAGFRVFVPLFVLSLTTHLGLVSLSENWEWMGGNMALFTLGAATLVELTAYLIPWVDHLLDTAAVPLAAVSGTAVVLSTLVPLDPVITWSLAIIAGGGSAALIKSTTASSRVVSTAATAGIANPVLSVLETGTAFLLSISAVFVPVFALILLIIIGWILTKLFRKIIPKANK